MSLADAVDSFCMALRRRQVEGALATSKRTAEVMRLLITSQRHADAQALLDDVREVGSKLQAAKPLELAIGNIVRRVLHMVREESEQEVQESIAEVSSTEELQSAAAGASTGKQALAVTGLLSLALRPPVMNRGLSLHNLLEQGPLPEGALQLPSPEELRRLQQVVEQQGTVSAASSDVGEAAEGDAGRKPKKKTSDKAVWKRKPAIIEQVNELIDELDEIDLNISLQASEYIHANEVILTFASSNTTLLFLKEASKKRDFQVVAAEGAPVYGGHRAARALAEAGIQTTLITDSAIFAMMARVNKVLVGTHALLANGGIIAPVGTHLVALAAREHRVPFVVLVGLHKLSPLFPHDPNATLNEFKSPGMIVDYDVMAEPMYSSDGSAGSKDGTSVHVHNPLYDYVPPELISLFVTDTGGYTPSYVYRLLAEYYSRDDYIL